MAITEIYILSIKLREKHLTYFLSNKVPQYKETYNINP